MGPVTNMSQLAGPLGGLIALAFGAGNVSGYGFAIRTAYKAVKERLDRVELSAEKDKLKFEDTVRRLEARNRELEDMLLGRRPIGVFSSPLFRSETEGDNFHGS